MSNYILTIRLPLNDRLDDAAVRQEAEKVINQIHTATCEYNPTIKLQRLVDGQAPIGVKLSGCGGTVDTLV